MRERDDLKVPGFHYCQKVILSTGRRMELDALDLVNYKLFASDKALMISGNRNPLKLV